MKITAKRRRSKLEIKEDKRKEEMEKRALVEKISEINTLQSKMAGMEAQMAMAATLHNQVQDLVNDGFVKQSDNGNLIPVEDESERDSIQQATGSKRRPGADQIDPDRRKAQRFDVSALQSEPSSFMEDEEDNS
jgi:hypothetical protein